jgi:protein-tyrosine phosphatase
MDSSNYSNVLRLARTKSDQNKVRLILNESNPSQNKSVPDPYYGGNEGFETVFNLLDEACEVICKRITEGTL